MKLKKKKKERKKKEKKQFTSRIVFAPPFKILSNSQYAQILHCARWSFNSQSINEDLPDYKDLTTR